MAVICCELIWLKSILHDFLIDHSWPALLYCDNKAALHIVGNRVFHGLDQYGTQFLLWGGGYWGRAVNCVIGHFKKKKLLIE